MRYGYPSPKRLQRGFFIGLILVSALAAFELFNFATTDYALASLLGEIQVLGIGWSSVLAVAFCAIDFAGLARLFTPEQGRDEPKEILFLTGAWFLGASMNAVMTWWAVSNALLGRPLGNEIVSREQMLAVVPIFVACLVWITRILIIGTFGVAGERLFSLDAGEKATAGASKKRTPRVTSGYRPPLRGSTASQQTRARSYNQPKARTTAPPRQEEEEEEEELVYEDLNSVGNTASSAPKNNTNRGYGSPPRGYTRSKTRPNPRPRYGYGMRSYSLNHPYPAMPRPQKKPGEDQTAGDPPVDITRYYG